MDQVHSINPFKSPFPLIISHGRGPAQSQISFDVDSKKQQQFEPQQQRKRRYQNHYYNP